MGKITLKKKCSKCKSVKILAEFYKNRTDRLGVRSSCKKCMDLNSLNYRLENPEKVRALIKKWNYKNKKHKALLEKQWRKKNKERVAYCAKQWYKENRELKQEYMRQWYIQNKDRRKVMKKQRDYKNRELKQRYNKAYYLKNKEKLNTKVYFYRQLSKSRKAIQLQQSLLKELK